MSLGVGGIVSVGGGTSSGSASGITTINPGTNIGPIVEFQGVNGIAVTSPSTNVVLIDGVGASGVGGAASGCFTQSFGPITSGFFEHNFGTRNLLVYILDDSGPPQWLLPDAIIHDTLDAFSVLFNRPQTGTVIAVNCDAVGTGTGSGGTTDGSGINAINGDLGPNIDLIGVSGINIVPQGNGQIFIGAVSTGACFAEEFTEQTILTVNHSLGTQNVVVQVQNTDRDVILPDNVRATDGNNVQVNFNRPQSGHVFVQACGANSGVRKFAQDFTNTTNVVVTHNLGSLDVIVQARDDASPATWFLPDNILFNTVNSLTLQFNSNRSGRVVVMG